MADQQSDTKKIPVLEEGLVLGRQTVDLGMVKVTKSTETRQAIVDERMTSEEVQIERRRIDRPVSSDAPPATRTEGDTTIIPVLEEIVVVEKRLVLREEIRVTRVRHERPFSQEVALQRERVSVERHAASGSDETEQPTARSTSNPPDPKE
jgi:uncharacterized protein (TIGR02271 family)